MFCSMTIQTMVDSILDFIQWIPDSRCWIPDLSQWIRHSTLKWDSRFLELHSKFQSPGFRIPQANSKLRKLSVCLWNPKSWESRIPESRVRSLAFLKWGDKATNRHGHKFYIFMSLLRINACQNNIPIKSSHGIFAPTFEKSPFFFVRNAAVLVGLL